MRTRTTEARTAIAASAAVLLVAGAANAGMLLELELYTGATPSGITTANPGSNIDIAVWMTPGTEGVSILTYDLVATAGVSVIGAGQSLVIPAGPNCPATPFGNCNMSPLGPAGGIGTNQITTLNEATVGIGPTGGKWLVAITRWNFASPVWIDIIVSIADDNALPAQPISPVQTISFGAIVPEPATASLLALGLGALALARRRRH